jgi:hypothetical protein
VSLRNPENSENTMRWNHYLSYFFGGAFLVNAIPHFVSGVTGHPFQSPFATPPGQGLSSALVNVLWGAFNFIIWYLLVCRVGTFELRRIRHVVVVGAGALLMALLSAHSFGRFYGGV